MNSLFSINPSLKSSSRMAVLLLLLLCCFGAQSCYNYRVLSTGDPDDLVPHKKTQVVYLWGIVQARDITADCDGIYEVNVSTNVGYLLLSVVTAGIVVPQKVEWKCAIDNIPVDTLGVP